MKTLAFLLIFATARPGYRYEFPRDHGPHRDFKTEWWYFTGNLFDPSGRRFGFELTFFRQAVGEPRAALHPWDAPDLYLAHLTLSDVAGQRFHHFERLQREGPGLAGATPHKVWNGNWSASPSELHATSEAFRLDLSFRSAKPPVIHGVNGVSQKAPGPGQASHYISLTRLLASGTLRYENSEFRLTGSAWMDHEFFTHQLTPEQTGWDWISIQLEDNTELMLFRLRRKDGSVDPHSAGTFIDAAGRATHLGVGDFDLAPGAAWNGYPVSWRISVPSLALRLDASTPQKNQELRARSRYTPDYWEGAMDFSGSRATRRLRGVGYLEMTGYRGAAPRL